MANMIIELSIIVTINIIIPDRDAFGALGALAGLPAIVVGGKKLETKLNEVFVGLFRIDKVGIVCPLNPAPKQKFSFGMGYAKKALKLCYSS